MGFSGVPEVVATNSPSYLPWLSAMLSPGRAVVSASRSSLLSETWVVAAGQVTLSPFGRVPSRPAVLAGLVGPARAGPGGNTVGVRAHRSVSSPPRRWCACPPPSTARARVRRATPGRPPGGQEDPGHHPGEEARRRDGPRPWP